METPVKGNLEVFYGAGPDDQNVSQPVAAATIVTAPVVIEAVLGFTNVTEVEPVERAGRLPVAEWEATTPLNLTVRVALWQEVPFEETAYGQQLAAAQAPPADPESTA